MGIRIIGLGKYLPEKVVTNEDYTKIVDTSDEWISTRTGIKSRRVETKLMSWEMGVEASKQALDDAGVKPNEVDLVIATTVSPDYLSPSMSCLVANGLSMKSPACFDINCACAGFVAAVDMAEKYLSSDAYQTVLIVSSEMMTKVLDFEDRTTCVLFGDGAGAAVLKKSDGLYTSFIGSDPSGAKSVFMRGIPMSNQFREEPFDPLSDGWEKSRGFYLYQNGPEVYKFATRALPKALKNACKKAHITPEELNWIFPHQANGRILQTAAKNLGLPMDKIYMNIEDHGNISSACIPICLCEAKEKNLLKQGDKLCLVGFGGGLVYAAAVFEYENKAMS